MDCFTNNNEINNKYKFISLGKHCNIKHNLDLFIKKTETSFFDWLRCDFKIVNKLFTLKDISSELLFRNNIIIYKFDKFNYGIEFKNIKNEGLTLLSHHDIKIYCKNIGIQIGTFIEKYKRRYDRLINNIITNDKKIIFIQNQNETIEESEKKQFVESILNINKTCNFYVAFLVCDKENSELISVKNKYSITINIRKFIKDDLTDIDIHHWTKPQYDWAKIFNFIIEQSESDN